MIETDLTASLVAALQEGADETRFAALLSERELSKIFPSLGIPLSVGTRYLCAAAAQRRPPDPDPTGQELFAYLSALRGLGTEFESLLRVLRDREEEIVAAAWRRASAYLPSPAPEARVRLVMLPLGLDFRTERETVYMDPLAAVSLGPEAIQTTLAHELHHVGRFRETGENLTLMQPPAPPEVTDVAEAFRDWATWLEAEGVADCVSNITQTDVPALHAMVEHRRQQLTDFASLLRQCFEALRLKGSRGAGTPERLETLHSLLRGLAHPIGARMAERIEWTGGRSALVECVGDPGRFVRTYNGSVEAGSGLRFDERWLEWLD